ncbi:MAG: DoxX family rane protein, partial [Amycolatopsis sp.]|uniref:hypothetical protein n=1 Tax=Amycolatopsis sp. TaxID=37632 RepID=UPI002636BF7B
LTIRRGWRDDGRHRQRHRTVGTPGAYRFMAGTFTALRIFMSLVWFSNGLAKLIDKGTCDWGFLSVNLATQGAMAMS